MGSISIQSDIQEIQVNLKEFSKEGLHEALAAALLKACLVVERDAKIKCPVGDGSLRASITSQVDKEELEGVVGTNVEYAPYVEIGTGIYSSKGDGRKTPWTYFNEKAGHFVTTVGMYPRPFLQPAMESNKDNIIKQFKGII